MEKMVNENGNNELKYIEEETSRRVYEKVIIYIFGESKQIDKVAVTVLSGHHWAKKRNFDSFFIQEIFDNDREHAKELLRYYSGKKTLQEVIDAIINFQAAIIYLRRIREQEPESSGDYENDKWAAKRYVAYLFFEDIRKNCIEDGVCPDFKINLISDEIIDLLKSLTVEDYCRIKGYLRFLDRNKIHGYDFDDYMYGMGYLDSVFLNCKGKKMKKLHKEKYKLLLHNEEEIKKAKQNTCYRLGCKDTDKINIEEFVNQYYTFIRKIISNEVEKKHAVEILKNLYNKSNSKIINMAEFLLKCLIASYVDEKDHVKIRADASKCGIEQFKEKAFKIPQIDPLFESF